MALRKSTAQWGRGVGQFIRAVIGLLAQAGSHILTVGRALARFVLPRADRFAILVGLIVLVIAAFLWTTMAGIVALGVALVIAGADVPGLGRRQ